MLVWHDLLGLTPGHVPRFVKRYADLNTTILEALQAYVADVKDAAFPDESHTYGMPEEELARFEAAARRNAPGRRHAFSTTVTKADAAARCATLVCRAACFTVIRPLLTRDCSTFCRGSPFQLGHDNTRSKVSRSLDE